MIEVIPAILTDSYEDLKKKISLIEPYTNRAHLDIADGIFVPNETIKGYPEPELISSSLKFEVHLMVKYPLNYINFWMIDNTDRFIIHVESEDVFDAIKILKINKKMVGLTLNPDTSIEELKPFLNLVDFIQFMTVRPGFQGRDFLYYVVKKIDFFHKLYPNILIAVDGGINPSTARESVAAGASILISGSFILKSGNVGKAIEQLKKIVENK
jgi:ribulose-phosphate 3-epimerase